MDNRTVKTILILAANPSNTARLRLDEEVSQIDQGLTRAKQRDQFELKQQWAVTPRTLQRALLDSTPHIVHFSGHGTGEEGLMLEAETGKAQLASTQALADLFELFADRIECVLLNACYSEVQATAIAQHIPYVIGMSQAIGDRAAVEFAIGFYDALAAGRSIEFAYKLGCTSIRLAGIAEHLTPILKRKAEPSRLPSGIPTVSAFYGRSQEIDQLSQWILRDRARLIAILGIGGIGKTTLAANLAQQLKGHFQSVAWLSLREAPPLDNLLSNVLKQLANHEKFATEASLNDKIDRILSYLKASNCLLILDNVESILEKGRRIGEYQSGYEPYSILLRRIGETSHQSCLLLTSREKPKEITEFEGENSPARCLNLSGLTTEAESILRDKGIAGSSAEFRQLVGLYNGNPLALKIVPETIKNIFDGSIADFLATNTAIFDDRISSLLAEQFNRLSNLEKSILFWLAIEREPVAYKDLENDLWPPVKTKDLLISINSLKKRSLVETIGAQFTLQNVIMEYVTDRLARQISEEIEIGRIDAFNQYALLKATAKDYVCEVQRRLILKPILNELTAAFGSPASLEGHLKQLISALQTDSKQRDNTETEPGYAGGNILNLLCAIKADLTGYDFSTLFIWQAFLRETNLHRVNFSQANLSKCIFAETVPSIFAIALHSGKSLLAVGDATGTIHVLDTINRQKLLVCNGHTRAAWAVAFSPDGQILASSSDDGTVKLWQVQTGHCLRTLDGHDNWVRAIAFHPNGQWLASGSYDRTVKLFNVHTGACVRTFEGHADWVRAIAVNWDGSLLATGGGDNAIRIWDVERGDCLAVLNGHTAPVLAVAFNPDGTLLATGGSDWTVRLWDMRDTRQITSLHCLEDSSNEVHTLAFSPDGTTLASGGQDKIVRLWPMDRIFERDRSSEPEDLELCKLEPRKLESHTSWIWGLAFHQDGHTLISGSADQSVRFWELASNEGRCVATWQGQTFWLRSVTFSPNGQQLISGGADRAIRVWDVATGQPTQTLLGHSDQVCAVTLNRNGRTLASGSWDGTLKIWDLPTSKCVVTLREHTSTPWSVAFSPNGQRLASGSNDSTVKLWDANDYRCLATLTDHQAQVYSVSFSADGQRLASASFDSTIKLWDTNTYQCLSTLKGNPGEMQTTVAFSADGQFLAAGNRNNTIRIWDLTRDEQIQLLEGHTGWLYAVAFSPRENLIASCGGDRTVRLWQVDRPTCLAILEGHQDLVHSVAFSPDGSIVASSSNDETIRLWEVASQTCIRVLKSPLPYEGMNLTQVTGLTEAQKSTLIALGAVTGEDARK